MTKSKKKLINEKEFTMRMRQKKYIIHEVNDTSNNTNASFCG